ncbi:tetratricopeptide repeat protein [Paraliomyxa miuraensis]|uniref:hypothetical protein n=1 Tax=Paraliomyxa miuraensis TaxID=376150 RepID=UPI00225A06C3|nr:hypothetical protein [Paraliomyxa miuraensis]MCX4244598.1 hypothetical protein [Paraliomyxa miuraensis]
MRQSRTLAPALKLLLSSRLWALAVVAGSMGACGGDAPGREPVPNPPPPAEIQESKAEAKGSVPLDDDAAAERYLEIKAMLEADPSVAKGTKFPELRADLEGIANGAGAAAMRANAAILLGSMHDQRGEHRKAAGFYEHAATLVPDDAGPHMAVAVARAATGEFAAAAMAQEKAAALDPDNLENWLALGELRLRAGDQEGSAKAYVAYELRRKGLIDGLTLHDAEGTPVVSVDDRIGCAEALAAAADQGTAYALIYAMRRDPEASVRAAVARVMGLQRLELYVPVLQTQSTEETDADVKEAVAWAVAEIARDPVKIEPTERPRLDGDDPRAAEGELPRADEAPAELTDESTLARDSNAALGGTADDPTAKAAGADSAGGPSGDPSGSGASETKAEPGSDAPP